MRDWERSIALIARFGLAQTRMELVRRLKWMAKRGELTIGFPSSDNRKGVHTAEYGGMAARHGLLKFGSDDIFSNDERLKAGSIPEHDWRLLPRPLKQNGSHGAWGNCALRRIDRRNP